MSVVFGGYFSDSLGSTSASKQHTSSRGQVVNWFLKKGGKKGIYALRLKIIDGKEDYAV